MKRTVSWILLTTLALVLLAACTEEPSAPQPTQPPAATEVPTEAPPPDVDLEAAAGIYVTNCSVCHGPEGLGVENLGKNLRTSAFLAGLSDTEVFEFITVGREADHPLNTTGVVMPPKGGNPALSDEDISAIVAFLRSIQE